MERNPRLRLVVGVDFSRAGDEALAEALALGRDRPPAELHAVHVATDEEVEDSEGNTRLERQDMLLRTVPEQVWARLDEVARRLHYRPGPTGITVHVRFGKHPAQTLHQVAVDYDADLIVVGTHNRRGVEKLVLGSVASELLGLARCPVLVARPKDFEGLPRTERIEPAPRSDDLRPSQPPMRETHVYVARDEISWAEHDSEVSATGV